jgi:hypothetical protein
MRTVGIEKERLSDIVAITGGFTFNPACKLLNSSLDSETGNGRQQMPFEKEISRLMMPPAKHAELM